MESCGEGNRFVMKNPPTWCPPRESDRRPDPSGSGLLVVLFGVVLGFWVWFGAAGLDCQAHLTYPPSEFVSVTCAFRHT